MSQIDLAVIGGSGFYEMPGLDDVEVIDLDTPYGRPSDAIRIGTIEGRRVAFLARHGPGHRYLPSEVPRLANFWALKSLGAERVLGVSAVGSLREVYAPGHFVVPDQLVDRTSGQRRPTFFGDGAIAHVALAEPFCPVMRGAIAGAARAAGATVHEGGAHVVIEGPAFGTRAESEVHRAWGMGTVGMTAMPEAKLAREAELCWGMLAAVTDYDAWHTTAEPVDAAMVFSTMQRNTAMSQEAIRRLAASLPLDSGCDCRHALDNALVTDPAAINEDRLEELRPILARRLMAAER